MKERSSGHRHSSSPSSSNLYPALVLQFLAQIASFSPPLLLVSGDFVNTWTVVAKF